MKKPRVYIVTNTNGGVRKSTTIAHLTFALRDAGQDPIIVSLDTNATLESFLEKDTEVIKWDVNDSDDSYEGLQVVMDAAEESGQPVVIDLAAKGGQTQGVHTILETYILNECEVISVVPVIPADKGPEGALEALRIINPNKWLMVQYGTDKRQKWYDRFDPFQKLLDMNPAYIIKPKELGAAQIDTLVGESRPLNKVGEYATMGSSDARKFGGHINFWNDLKGQYHAAFQKLNLKDNVEKCKATAT